MKITVTATILGVALAFPLAQGAFAQSRIDVNGGLARNNNTNGSITGDIPFFWNTYSTGAGGGSGSRYAAGGSSDAFAAEWEDEDPYYVGGQPAGPNGHSVILGGAGGAGTYGYSQTASSIAGRVYWFGGSAKIPGGWNANSRFEFGLNNGAGIGGTIYTAQLSNSAMGRGSAFYTSVVATGSQVTASFGINSAGSHGINQYVDGLRVWEFPVVNNIALQNGNFSGGYWNLTEYTARGSDGSEREQFIPVGWVPMGTAAGRVQRYYAVANDAPGGNVAMWVDQFNGQGRSYLVQKVKVASNWLYTLTGDVFQFAGASDTRIGIDPTGGLDPLSASIIWSTAPGANSAWETKTISSVLGGANGVTIFLASGSTAYTGNATAGGKFANIKVTAIVPEPSSMVALASGMLGLAGLIRRRK